MRTSTPTRWAALGVLLLGTFAGMLDLFIVTVATPSIQRDLGAGLGGAQWMVAGYTLAYAVALVTGGRLGDAYGARRVYRAGTVLFALTSLACAAAPTPGALIAARVLQGLSAAAMLPQVLALIQALFPDEPARRRALGRYSATIGVAAVAGPLLGGALISLDVASLGWRAIFCVNAPVCAVILAGIRWWIPAPGAPASVRPVAHGASSVRAGRPALDVPGAALLAGGLVAGLLPLTGGGPVGLVAAAVVLLAAFAWWEARLARRGGAPLLPPRLLRQRTFVPGLAAGLFFYGGNGALVFLTSYYLQHGPGLSAFGTGLRFAPVALASALGSASAGRLVTRFGHRVTAAGAGLMIAGALATALAAVASGPLVPGLTAYGLGSGLVVPSLLGLTLAGVRPDDAGAASGGLLTVAQAAGAIGVAALGALYAAARSPAAGYGAALLADAAAFAALAVLLIPLGRR